MDITPGAMMSAAADWNGHHSDRETGLDDWMTREGEDEADMQDGTESLVVVFESPKKEGVTIAGLCRSLGARVEVLADGERIFEILHYMQPVAVISDIVLDDQDGFNVMKAVAGYDRDLPVLMVTGDNPVLIGAVDAVAEIWGMTRVWTLDDRPHAPPFAEFLAGAGVANVAPPIGQLLGQRPQAPQPAGWAARERMD